MSIMKVSDIPTFARWTEIGVTENDNALNGYIKDLTDMISELVVIEDDFAPSGCGESSDEYITINKSCRLMALLLSDLKSIRREVQTIRLMNKGLDRKGGAA